jgi:hypothetical protein
MNGGSNPESGKSCQLMSGNLLCFVIAEYLFPCVPRAYAYCLMTCPALNPDS